MEYFCPDPKLNHYQQKRKTSKPDIPGWRMDFTNKSNFLKEQLMDKLGARMDVFFFYQIKIFSQYEFMINFWTFTGHASFSFCFLVFIWSHFLQFCQMMFEYKNVFVILTLFIS